MKRQTLQIGSALLATTALSTTAFAGTIETGNNATSASAAITAASLSAQVFGATGGSSVTLGPVAYNIDFTNQLTTSFDVDLEVTGAKFSTSGGAVAARPFFEDASFTLTPTAHNTANNCTVQVLTERILVDNCLFTATCRIDVLQLSGIVFNQANGLATAGSSVALSGIVTGNTGNQTFELISSANVVTSANALTTTSSAGGTAGVFTINNTATPPFANISTPTTGVNSPTSSQIGVVDVTLGGTVSTDLTTALAAATASGGFRMNVSGGVLSDAATVDLQVSGPGVATLSASGSALAANSASFGVAAANSLGSFQIRVNFSGGTAISAWPAASVDVTYTPGGLSLSAPAALSGGTLASFSRGGFQAQINTAQSTAVADFDSFVRITNNGSVAGTASIQVADDADGSVYGTFTTGTLVPNSTMQISMATIEAGITGLTPAGQYMLNISGAISGYAQHVMLNTQNGTFVDLSGFRIGNATTGFP